MLMTTPYLDGAWLCAVTRDDESGRFRADSPWVRLRAAAIVGVQDRGTVFTDEQTTTGVRPVVDLALLGGHEVAIYGTLAEVAGVLRQAEVSGAV